MKVVAFNGSPRKYGNTTILILHAFEELEKAGIETELVQLAGKKIRGCTACMKCFENRNQRCAITGDVVNECIEKMIGADGIILGSPIFFGDVTPEMKALIDRCGYVSMANGGIYRHKAGAGIFAARKANPDETVEAVVHFFLAAEMVIPGTWGIANGLFIGEVEQDQEGMERMKIIGRNMAWFLKIMDYAKKHGILADTPKGRKHVSK
jgi:multimeric flavodoxin WrbA